MKRTFCLLLALVFVFALGAQAFADDVLYCRICGRQIPVDSNVCPYCGVAVVHMDETPVKVVPIVGKSPSPATDVPASAAPSDPGPFNSNIRTSASGRLRVTKSPTSESVPYGGSCLFIAHAENASAITWYIANADASVICEASEAASCNNGLYVSGSKAETLSLSGIPSWMNGYQVQACFSSSEGKVYTDVAKIWTYAPSQQKRCTCWEFPEWWYLNNWCWDRPWCWEHPWWNPWINDPLPPPPPDPGNPPTPPDPGNPPTPPDPGNPPTPPDPGNPPTPPDPGNPPTPPDPGNPPTPPDPGNPPTPPDPGNPPTPPDPGNPPTPPDPGNPPTPPDNPGTDTSTETLAPGFLMDRFIEIANNDFIFDPEDIME